MERCNHMPSPVGMLSWITGCIGVAVAVSARRLGDFDLPWHLAYGRLVATTGSVPATDDLAYTHSPIEYAEFVADLFLYATVRLTGPLGLQVLGGILAAVLLTVLSWGRLRSPAGPLLASLCVAAASAWLVVRPATFSFVLLAWTLIAIEIHRSTPCKRRRTAVLMLLIPTHILWANLHGFVVVGLSLVVGYSLYRAACTVARGRLGAWMPEGDAGELRWTAATAVGCVLGAMVNNAGPRLLLAPFRVMPDVGHVTE